MISVVHDCPRCGAKKITFTVHGQSTAFQGKGMAEVLAVCNNCHKANVLVLGIKNDYRQNYIRSKANFFSDNLNHFFHVEGYVSIKDLHPFEPPKHLPELLDSIFREGAACLSISCYNAAASMFRLCLDLATKDLLPEDGDGTVSSAPNKRQRKVLFYRIQWLIQIGLLPENLSELVDCVRCDGNDGVHDGTIQKAEAEDLLDFSVEILEQLYTYPARVKIAKANRERRRKNSPKDAE